MIFRLKNTLFLWIVEKYFAGWIIIRNFAVDFKSEITEALYLFLVSENVRSFLRIAGISVMVRAMAWAGYIFPIQGNSHNRHLVKWYISTTLRYKCFVQFGAVRAIKVAPDDV
ncbi:MAG: hypothetical protein IJ524_01070 [Bacteroidales bacterium]|nr:hypothetical protein [Bacteroidales bacterium]